MQNLRYGQPIGGITQISYVVEDIEVSMKEYTRHMNVGPWFVSAPIQTKDSEYRGNIVDFKLRLAIAYSGHTQIELIQQLDDQPSVFRELIQRSGFGFHHFGVATKTIDEDVARLQAQGGTVAFRARSQRGARVVYLDGIGHLPGMIELIEMTDAQESFYTNIYAAALTWDGTDPIRDTSNA